MRALGVFADRAMLPLAAKFHASSDATVRASCVKAYAQIASNRPGIAVPAEAMAALEAALHDDSPVVAITAVMALGQVGSQALPLLLAAIIRMWPPASSSCPPLKLPIPTCSKR